MEKTNIFKEVLHNCNMMKGVKMAFSVGYRLFSNIENFKKCNYYKITS